MSGDRAAISRRATPALDGVSRWAVTCKENGGLRRRQGEMSRNIVVCCDGTGNDFDDPNTDSNVIKLYKMLAQNREQAVFYHPGVGTMGAPTARGRIEKQWSRLKGLAFGAGLMDLVADAYRFLMEQYASGDNIFIFGFSRGAYAARAIASVLHVFGLLRQGNENLIPYILRLYTKRTKEAKRRQPTFDTENNFKYSFSRPVEIHFCGIWDTVSSYGWLYSPIDLPFAGQNPIIRTGRHAISIDERRCCFQANLWGEALPGQNMRQVWFTGAHSDVGGSYLECEAGLSKIALEWMLVEAQQYGLLIDGERAKLVLGYTKPVPERFIPDYVKPDNETPKHESLCGPWWILEYLLRRDPNSLGGGLCLPRGKWRRQIPQGSLIHQSVITGKYGRPLPPFGLIEKWQHYCAAATDDKQLQDRVSQLHPGRLRSHLGFGAVEAQKPSSPHTK
jgi:uncharacterized protein (DUF2235 family)